MKTIYLVASGDLRLSANQKCQDAQAALEKDLIAAIEKEGHKVQRAHPYDKAKKHGFIDSQKYGMEVFRNIPVDAPLIIAEAVWQYSHHRARRPHHAQRTDPDRRELERHLARPRRHAEPERLAREGERMATTAPFGAKTFTDEPFSSSGLRSWLQDRHGETRSPRT